MIENKWLDFGLSLILFSDFLKDLKYEYTMGLVW